MGPPASYQCETARAGGASDRVLLATRPGAQPTASSRWPRSSGACARAVPVVLDRPPAGQYASVAIVQHGIDVSRPRSRAPDERAGDGVGRGQRAPKAERGSSSLGGRDVSRHRARPRRRGAGGPHRGHARAATRNRRRPTAVAWRRCAHGRSAAAPPRGARLESLRQAAKSARAGLTAWRESGNRREEVARADNLPAVSREHRREPARAGPDRQSHPLAHDAGDRALEERVLSRAGRGARVQRAEAGRDPLLRAGTAPSAPRKPGDLGGQRRDASGNLAGLRSASWEGEGPRADGAASRNRSSCTGVSTTGGRRRVINLNNIGLLHNRQLGDYEQALAM